MEINSINDELLNFIEHNIAFAICFHPDENEGELYSCRAKDVVVTSIGEVKFNQNDSFLITEFGLGPSVKTYVIPRFPGTAVDDDDSPKFTSNISIQPEEDSTTQAWHQDAVRRVASSLINVDSKVVLSRVKSIKSYMSPFNAARVFFQKHPSCFRHISWTPHTGLWFGCTPETLAVYNHASHNFFTMSLAGTRRNHIVGEWDKKNNHEHDTVTRHIVTTLRRNQLDVKVSKPSEVKFGSITHLCNNIEGCGTTDLNQLIADLSPTPAVCGYPRELAFDYIKHLESHSRHLYSGIIGTTSETITELYVNLRCVMASTFSTEDGYFQYNLYAGGGINKFSVAEEEWLETEDKMKSLSECLSSY